MGRGAGQVVRLWRGGMIAMLPVVLCLLRPAFAGADAGVGPAIGVPSGQEVHWLDTIQDTQGTAGLTLRYRFLAPQIGGADPIDAEIASADMQALCDSYVLPRLSTVGPQPQQIVISLSDRPVQFGETDTDAVQYFEAYSVEDGACVWEMF